MREFLTLRLTMISQPAFSFASMINIAQVLARGFRLHQCPFSTTEVSLLILDNTINKNLLLHGLVKMSEYLYSTLNSP